MNYVYHACFHVRILLTPYSERLIQEQSRKVLKQAVCVSNWTTSSNMSPELFVSLVVQLFNPFIMFWSPLKHGNFKVEMLHAVIANIRFVNEISEGTVRSFDGHDMFRTKFESRQDCCPYKEVLTGLVTLFY
jgi:hypothetical protein